MTKPWWAALAGVAFVVVLIVSFAVGGEPPDADEPVREIVEHYVDNKDAIEVGAILSAFAGALLIFFAGILRQVLRRAEGPEGVLSLVAFSGAVIVAIGAAIDASLSFAIAEGAEDVDPIAVQALQTFWDNDFLPFLMGSFVFTLAAGLSIVRHGALPKWLGWIAIALAVISLTPIGFIGFVGAGLWVLVASILLTVQARGASSGEPPPPPLATTPA
jgi:hypothetical protein